MKAASLRRNFLWLFFLLVPLVYLPLEEQIDVGNLDASIFNYVSVLLLYMFIILSPPGRLNRRIINVFAVIFAVLVVNLFAPYASTKWFFNQVGFLGCSIIIALIYARVNEGQIAKIRTALVTTGTVCFVILAACSLYLTITRYDLLIRALETRDFNSFIYQLVPLMSWEKQSIGNFAALIFAVYFVFKRRQTPLFLLLCLPLLIGIRTFWLGIILAVSTEAIRRRRHLASMMVFIVLYFIYRIFSSGGFGSADHRVFAYLNTFDIVRKNPLGLGLGGYHVYTYNNEEALSAKFAYLTHGKVAIAPESDIVLVFGSLGLLLGLIFYSVHLWVFYQLWRKYPRFSDVDRFFSFLFFIFLFSGLSQDSMFRLPHWILFGFALGAVVSGRSGTGKVFPAFGSGKT